MIQRHRMGDPKCKVTHEQAMKLEEVQRRVDEVWIMYDGDVSQCDRRPFTVD